MFRAVPARESTRGCEERVVAGAGSAVRRQRAPVNESRRRAFTTTAVTTTAAATTTEATALLRGRIATFTGPSALRLLAFGAGRTRFARRPRFTRWTRLARFAGRARWPRLTRFARGTVLARLARWTRFALFPWRPRRTRLTRRAGLACWPLLLRLGLLILRSSLLRLTLATGSAAPATPAATLAGRCQIRRELAGLQRFA